MTADRMGFREQMGLYPRSKPLPKETVERDNLIHAYLSEQYEPVTIGDIAGPKIQEGLGDYQTHGGLDLPQSQVRMSLERLILTKRVERLEPLPRSTAHRFVAL